MATTRRLAIAEATEFLLDTVVDAIVCLDLDPVLLVGVDVTHLNQLAGSLRVLGGGARTVNEAVLRIRRTINSLQRRK